MPWSDSPDLLAPLAPWFLSVRRNLPWRAQDLRTPHPDPYAVLVSEIMLQQTQVDTVIPYFQRWMEACPNPATLARLDEDRLHKLWEGLGYYRRARFLHGAATRIAVEGWPTDLNGLLSLPGLGPYTAAAIASIAFLHPEPALDGNAFRVLARLLALPGDPKKAAVDLREWLKPALRVHGPSILTQGIMELGALVCTPSTPACPSCPLQPACLAHARALTTTIPPKQARPAPRELDLLVVAATDGAFWLLVPPPRSGLLSGLWRWPHRELQADQAAPPIRGLSGWTLPGWTQVYTHRRERVVPVALQLDPPMEAPAGLQWVPTVDLPQLPMGRRDGRLRDLLGTLHTSNRKPLDGPHAGHIQGLLTHPL